ncbi:ABC transporter substrate-binding protein [Microbacterium xanthum]|uniref:ABC transporter substrate-binding protein n=1 Tax=Microbacterium xanthum TaxID=3079794 RepID=UPI002AD2BF59|nr:MULTISPECIES: ABC transporter substrate-binding protein [unclassified Microbacterium]MDZ8172246.1 ABC transporter substrate-binding protein [Microbacterium sp. KSW-48]MDZ8202036.1 ABC transporter substrate-binding protein [Microbacterium sp. SSW1-59]
MFRARPAATLSLVAASALLLAGCAGSTEPEAVEAAASSDDYYPVTVTDMAGNDVTIESADAVGITDNRFFGIAEAWDLPIVVAPRALMSTENAMKTDEEILDTGFHGEPDLEQFVAADPDLIINGYRYGGETGPAVQEVAPDAAFVSMDAAEELTADEYVVQSVTLMGEVFNKQDEAAALIEEFETAIDDASAAYDPSETVMGLITSGGEINYSNPTDGRGASIFFDLVGLTPALDTEGSSEHTGDSVSLEALAEANADYFLVLDRDAAVSEEGEEATPALELINSSAALSTVPAVQDQAIYVMPADYYLTEDVYAYITVLDGMTEMFSAGS